MDVIGHNDIAQEFEIMFVSIVVETINQWNDKGRAYENGQTVM
jgi:hypothetical protein